MMESGPVIINYTVYHCNKITESLFKRLNFKIKLVTNFVAKYGFNPTYN